MVSYTHLDSGLPNLCPLLKLVARSQSLPRKKCKAFKVMMWLGRVTFGLFFNVAQHWGIFCN